jgi:predicted acetyltransferase
MVLKPRQLKQRTGDAVWLRVVDVKTALEGRIYAADDTLTFELTDTFREANNGTWTMTVIDGKAEVSDGAADPDLSFDAGDLGATYLGGMSFDQLARAGRVVELKPGSVRRADAMFHSSRAPWNPEIF